MESHAPRPKIQRSKEEKYHAEPDGFCPQLFGFLIAKNMWSSDRKRGHIRHVRAEDIAVTGGGRPESAIMGYSEAHVVEDVAFGNVTINGGKVADLRSGRIKLNAFVKGVVIK